MTVQICLVDNCERPVIDGERRCIFHDDDVHKDVDDFTAQLLALIGTGKSDLSRFVFPIGFQCDFFIDNCPENASFCFAEFNSYIKFRKFSGNVSFAYATFHENADFQDAVFPGEAAFHHAEFIGYANFKCVNVAERAEFSEVNFQKGATFDKAKFFDDAVFKECMFMDYANFTKSEFRRNVFFYQTTLATHADFTESKFCIDERERESSNESREVTPYLAHFPEVKFEGGVDFSSSHFFGKTVFENSEFIGEACFNNTDFDGGTEFIEADFEGKATFRSTKFNQPTIFTRAIFKKQAEFQYTRFTGLGSFRQARFEDFADFTGSRFYQEANFNRARFLYSAEFVETHFQGCEDQAEGPGLEFKNVFVKEGHKVFFKSVCLARAILLNSNIERITFEDVTWAKHGKGASKRQGVCESGLSKPEIMQMYREVKRNYEEKRDYSIAGEFHIGEMDTYREIRKTNGDRYYTFPLTTYRLISFYGERWLRPLAIFFGLSILMGVAISIVGVQVSRGEITETIKGFGDFFTSLSHGIQISTALERPSTFILPQCWAGTTLGIFMTIVNLVGPALIVLFLLALRRNFKR